MASSDAQKFPQTHNKVMSFRLTASNIGSVLSLHSNLHDAAEIGINECRWWIGDDEIYERDTARKSKKKEKDIKTVTSEKIKELWTKHTDHSVPLVDFIDMLKFVAQCAIYGDSRALASTLFGKSKAETRGVSTEDMTVIRAWIAETDAVLASGLSPKKKKKKEKEAGKKERKPDVKMEMCRRIRCTMVQCGYFRRFPFEAKIDNGGERGKMDSELSYVSARNLLRCLSTWRASSVMRRDSYLIEEERIKEAESKMTPEIIDGLRRLYRYCAVDHDFLKWFGGRIIRHIDSCLAPAIAGNTGRPTGGESFTVIYDRRKKRDVKITYSVPEEIYGYLSSHPELVAIGKDGMTPISRHADYLEMIASHEKHRWYATFPTVGKEDGYRTSVLLGKNYLTYDLSYDGESVPDKKINVISKGQPVCLDLHDGRRVSSLYLTVGESAAYDIAVRTAKRHDEKPADYCRMRVHLTQEREDKTYNDPYFSNMEIWRAGDQVYAIEFDRHGARYTAIVKEPSVEYRNKKLYLRVNMVLDSPSRQDDKDMYYAYMTAYPSSNPPVETSDNKKRFERLGPGRRAIGGIDIGIGRPYVAVVASYEVGPAGTEQKFQIEDRLIEDDGSSPYDSLYNDFLTDIRTVSRIIEAAKKISEGDLEDIPSDMSVDEDGSIAATMKRMSARIAERHHLYGERKSEAYATFLKMNHKQRLDILLTQKASNATLKQLVEEDPSFLPRICVYYVISVERELKNKHRNAYLDGLTVDEKYSGETKRGYAQKRLNSMLRAYSALGEEETDEVRTFSTRSEKVRNMAKNAIKRNARKLVNFYVGKGIRTIVAEDTDPTKSRNDGKKSNRIKAAWSPKQFLAAVKNAAQWHGLEIAEVDPRMTSQVHPETGLIGYRDGDTLHCPDGSKIDADVAGAANVCRVFAGRGLWRFSINTNIDISNKDEKKRLRAYIVHHFGSESNWEKFRKQYPSGTTLYLHGREWLTAEEHKSAIDRIRDDVGRDAENDHVAIVTAAEKVEIF